jgi:hypothetical protein
VVFQMFKRYGKTLSVTRYWLHGAAQSQKNLLM